MLVSNTETAKSRSNETLSITNLTPFSNSLTSPNTTSVSKVSIKVKEKLKNGLKIVISF